MEMEFVKATPELFENLANMTDAEIDLLETEGLVEVTCE